MKVKNISDGIINLKSGSIKPGETGVSNSIEYKMLMHCKKIENVQFKKKETTAKTVTTKTVTTEDKTNG
jgi:hypothetical protein